MLNFKPFKSPNSRRLLNELIALWIVEQYASVFSVFTGIFPVHFDFIVLCYCLGFGEAIQSNGSGENRSEESWKAAFAVQEKRKEEITAFQNGMSSLFILMFMILYLLCCISKLRSLSFSGKRFI